MYPLDFILLIVFLSTISGCNSWYKIEDYTHEYEAELRSLYAELRSEGFTGPTPTHDASLKRTENVAQVMDTIQEINSFIIQRLKEREKCSILRIQKKLACLTPRQSLKLKF